MWYCGSAGGGCKHHTTLCKRLCGSDGGGCKHHTTLCKRLCGSDGGGCKHHTTLCKGYVVVMVEVVNTTPHCVKAMR